MPNAVVHHYFSSKVFDGLPHDIQSQVDTSVFYHASFGPDIWFSALYTNREHRSLAERCSYMHRNKCGKFFAALVSAVKHEGEPQLLFTYLCGFLCHYFLDYMTHPYILYKTGNTFDHVRFELALDCILIHDIYGCKSAEFNFSRILPDKTLPSKLKDPLDRIYYDVFDWTNAFSDLASCSLGLHRFFSLIRDPFGLYAWYLKYKNRLSHPAIIIQTYHKKDELCMKADFLNASHRTWKNPFAPELTSSDSFIELMQKALKSCIDCIHSCYYYIFASEEIDLFDIIGDKNYESGLECSNIKNAKISCFDNIFREQN